MVWMQTKWRNFVCFSRKLEPFSALGLLGAWKSTEAIIVRDETKNCNNCTAGQLSRNIVGMPVSDVWLTPTPSRESRLWRVSSSAIVLLVSVCGKVLLSLNKTCIFRKEAFERCVAKRPKHKPLITVSNHYSMVDDFLTSYMLSWKQLSSRSSVRWLPGAKDVCCRSKKTSLFFQLGRVIPVVRGEGVYQQGMDFCVQRLNEGEWVHVYPEGKVNTTKDLMRLKWGIGRLVAESEISPIILPYWHLGMEDVWPTRKPYYPRLGHKVTVVFGEPLDFEEDLKKMREQEKTEEEVRKYITDKVEIVFAALKSETEMKHSDSRVLGAKDS